MQVLNEYAQLKIKIKELELKLKLLKPDVEKTLLEILGDDLKQSVDMDLGTFSVIEAKKWRFSDNVAALKQEVEDLEIREKQDGTAEFDTAIEVRFNIKK